MGGGLLNRNLAGAVLGLAGPGEKKTSAFFDLCIASIQTDVRMWVLNETQNKLGGETMTIKFTKIEAANNKNSAIWEAKILDQVWRFQVRKYWGSDTAGGSTASCCECWRVSGGNGSQKLTASSRKRAVQVIKSRIENHVW